jgi:multimeric flavodoxin WrbA
MAGNVLGIVGSPNRGGRTFQMVNAALQGAANAGAQVELIQLSDHVVGPCHDCESPQCMAKHRCSYDDPAFDYLSEKLLDCGALVLGSPVYWMDTSAMIRYLFFKMLRIHALSGPLAGLPAVGIGVAGFTGNGLVSGLRATYQFFLIMQIRALAPHSVTRFNWESALSEAERSGAKLAAMTSRRHPFESLEERLLWYDNLPNLNLSRAGERRLLAAIAAQATVHEAGSERAGVLARSEELAAGGNSLESLKLSTAVYEESVKMFDSTPR